MTRPKEWPIIVRFEVDEHDRIVIADFYGMKGMAPLAQCRGFLRTEGYGGLDLAKQDYDRKDTPSHEQ